MIEKLATTFNGSAAPAGEAKAVNVITLNSAASRNVFCMVVSPLIGFQAVR